MVISAISFVFFFSTTIATSQYKCQLSNPYGHQGRQDLVSLLQDKPENYAEAMSLQGDLQKVQNQNNLQNQTTKILSELANTQTQMAQTQTQMAKTQTEMAHTQAEMANTQTQIANTLTQMASTQTQTADTFNKMASTQTNVEAILTQIDSTQIHTDVTLIHIGTTQTQMEQTLAQMAITQTQMAETLTQVVNLLQTQGQQLQKITTAMATTVSLLKNEKKALANISNSLSFVLKQQKNQMELLSTLHRLQTDCADIAAQGYTTNKPYTITPEDGMGSLTIYCDMQTAGGGWTVFQRRYDGSVDFYLRWKDYEQGFGSPDGEHWVGLKEMHRLTRMGTWTLRIDIEDFDGNTSYAEYQSFSLGDAGSNYALSIGTYSGTAGDSLGFHNKQDFSTKDRDHDVWIGENCARDNNRGAWWYYSCAHSNLNGQYLGPSQDSGTGMGWYHWKNSWEALKRSEMKMRRVQ